MKVKVILNPYANRWGAKEQIPAVRQAFESAGVAYDLFVTEWVGHGKALASDTAGYDAVVAAGGDSTVSEVVNGLISSSAHDGPTRPLGVLPLGTGNDFNDMAGLPRGLDECIKIIADGCTRPVDAARITFDGQTHYFDNNCAAAMEPMVTMENIKMTRLSGNIRYIVALARALMKLKAWRMNIQWDDGSYEGPAYLLSVCNSARTGGVFYMAPGAEMNDGRLDFVFAPEIPKRQVLAILPRLFRGTHIDHPAVTFGRTTRLTLDSQPGTPIHADGELIAESATILAYQVLPQKITLLCPRP
jgi:diacylglycerol kinase (ATP)